MWWSCKELLAVEAVVGAARVLVWRQPAGLAAAAVVRNFVSPHAPVLLAGPRGAPGGARPCACGPGDVRARLWEGGGGA